MILHRRQGKSINTTLVYEQEEQDDDKDNDNDEVEDLYKALQTAQQRFPEATGVSSGAILSTYQRVRIENVCNRLGLTSLSYLWRMSPQHDLLKRMLEDGGLDAVLVKTACPPGLVPRKHLNQTLATLYYSGLFQRLHDQYQFHMCGEGGEFESLVLDCPLYQRKLVLTQVEIVETNDDDGAGELVIHQCHSEPKEPTTPVTATTLPVPKHTNTNEGSNTDTSTTTPRPSVCQTRHLPQCRRLGGGLLHFSEIMSPSAPVSSLDTPNATSAVAEAKEIFVSLRQALQLLY